VVLFLFFASAFHSWLENAENVDYFNKIKFIPLFEIPGNFPGNITIGINSRAFYSPIGHYFSPSQIIEGTNLFSKGKNTLINKHFI